MSKWAQWAPPPNKAMKLTKLSAAPWPRMEVPPHARAGRWTRAPLRSLSPVFGGPTEQVSEAVVALGRPVERRRIRERVAAAVAERGCPAVMADVATDVVLTPRPSGVASHRSVVRAVVPCSGALAAQAGRASRGGVPLGLLERAGRSWVSRGAPARQRARLRSRWSRSVLVGLEHDRALLGAIEAAAGGAPPNKAMKLTRSCRSAPWSDVLKGALRHRAQSGRPGPRSLSPVFGRRRRGARRGSRNAEWRSEGWRG